VCVNSWLSCMSTYSISTGNDHFWTSVQCRLRTFDSQKKKLFFLLLLFFFLQLVKWRSRDRWDIIIITYPWGERLNRNSIQFRMTLLLFSMEQWRWWHQWNVEFVYSRKFIQSWVRQAKERRRKKKKKGYQSLYVCMWMVTINGRFYRLIEEDLNRSYLKLNIIYRYKNNGGSQNRCRVKEKVFCMLSQ
jgi:hypothetical protein